MENTKYKNDFDEKEESDEDLSFMDKIEGKPAFLLKKLALKTENINDNKQIQESSVLCTQIENNKLSEGVIRIIEDKEEKINPTITTVSLFGNTQYKFEEKNKLTPKEMLLLRNSILELIKTILSISSEILEDQGICWLSFIRILDDQQKKTIKDMIEKHTLLPVSWIDNGTIELSLSSDKKLIKKPRIQTGNIVS